MQSAFYINIQINPFTGLARRHTATGAATLSLLMPVDTVVNAFCLSGNVGFMHLAVKFTTRIRPFKCWPAGTPYTTAYIFPPKTPWIYLITISICRLSTRALFTHRFGRPPCWKMHEHVLMHQASTPWYWGLKNNWGMQFRNGLQNLWGNTMFFILCQAIRCHCS